MIGSRRIPARLLSSAEVKYTETQLQKTHAVRVFFNYVSVTFSNNSRESCEFSPYLKNNESFLKTPFQGGRSFRQGAFTFSRIL